MPDTNPYNPVTEPGKWAEWQAAQNKANNDPLNGTFADGRTAREVYANEIKTQPPLPNKGPSTSYTPAPPRDFDAENRNRLLAQGKADGFTFLDGRDPGIANFLTSKGFAQLREGFFYNPKTNQGYELDPKTGVLKYDATPYVNAQERQQAAAIVLRGGNQAPNTNPVAATGSASSQQSSYAPFYDLAKAGTLAAPSTLGRAGAVIPNGLPPLSAPQGYKYDAADYRYNRGALGVSPVLNNGFNGTPALSSVLVGQNYNPSTAFQPGNDLVTQGYATPWDINGSAPGGEATLVPTGYSTGELRGGEAGGLGFNVGSNSTEPGYAASGVLSSYGYQVPGDPVAAAAQTANLIQQRDAMVASGMSLDQANQNLMAPNGSDVNWGDWAAANPGGSTVATFDSAGGPISERVQDTSSGYIFTGAAKGADMMMSEPFAVVNLRNGRGIIGSEYGQNERLRMNDNRLSIQPMGKPMSQLPDMTGYMMAADGATMNLQSNDPNGNDWSASLPTRPPEETTTPQEPTAPASAPTSAYSGGNWTPATWYQNGYAFGRDPISGKVSMRTDNSNQQPLAPPIDLSGVTSGSTQPSTPGPGEPGWPGVPGTGGPGTGGGGIGGGGGGAPGPTQPGNEVEDAVRRARDQRLRDVYAYQYAAAGLPNQQALNVNEQPGINAPTGFYWQTPDWSSAVMQAQRQLLALGQTGNTAQLQQQLAALMGQSNPDYAQIDALRTQLAKAQQADELRNQIANMRAQIGGGTNTGMPAQPSSPVMGIPGGPNGVEQPMPTDMLPQANTPLPQAPDMSHSEFNWLSRRAPRETSELLKLDYQLNQYGDVAPSSITQTEEAIQAISDENTRVRAEDMLRRIVSRMNAPRGNVPRLDVSPPPEDPFALIAAVKFAR